MSSVPKLYHNVASPVSWSVRMLAKYVDLPLDLAQVDMLNMEHVSATYLKHNPMGTVPAMIDNGFNISESHTINLYLLRKHRPEYLEELYPSDIQARALVDQAMYFDTGVAFISLKNIAKPALQYGLASISPHLEQQVHSVYGVMDAYLGRCAYAAGDHVTLADFSLLATLAGLEEFVPVDGDRFPRTAQWLSVMQEKDYYKEIVVPGRKALGYAVRAYMEKNRIAKENKNTLVK